VGALTEKNDKPNKNPAAMAIRDDQEKG